MSTIHNDIVDRITELGFAKKMSIPYGYMLQVKGLILVVRGDKFAFAEPDVKINFLKKKSLWPK